EVDGVLTAAVQLGVALLPAEAAHLGDRHADDADAGQGLLDVVQLERLDDRLDLFHSPTLPGETARATPMPHEHQENRGFLQPGPPAPADFLGNRAALPAFRASTAFGAGWRACASSSRASGGAAPAARRRPACSSASSREPAGSRRARSPR